jgi:hypothetical protein
LEIKSIFKNLSNREKMLIIGAVGVLAVFLIYQTVYVPLMRSRDLYDREKIELENMYGTYELLAGRYLAGRSSYEQFRSRLQRKASLSVLTYLENQAKSAGVRDNIEYIRPKGTTLQSGIGTSTVEMKINAIAANDLLIFLGGVEQGRDGVLISYLRLKPFFKEKDKLDAIVRVVDISID